MDWPCFKAVKEATRAPGFVTGATWTGLDHPAFNWVNTMIGKCEKLAAGRIAIRSERSIYQGILRNTASGLIIVLTSKSMLVELGHAVVASLRCHIGS